MGATRIRALIVDDEPPARARLRQLLEAEPGVTVIGEAGSAEEARARMRDARPDVLFLDIEMPETRGTTLAASLPSPRPFVVFVTAYDRYALDAFACDAVDYLLKPVSRGKLAATISRLRDRLAGQSDLEREVATASALQADMWPGALPAIPGFACAAASLPARGVGGDVYDAFAIADGRWGLLLGDVSGKGVAAGLVATAVQGRVQTAARHARLNPAALAATLNLDIYASTQGQRYATLVYGVLDDRVRRLQLVSAGHPATLLWRPGEVDPVELGATGPAIGLMDRGQFTTHDVALDAGSVLIACTDGVYEAMDERDEEFGVDRVGAVVTAHREAGPAAICTALLDAVRRHRGGRQGQDDVTVLVVESVKARRTT